MSTRGNDPDDIDHRVAARLRQRRLALNLDARLVDAAIGENPGTVEKFERAERRVGAAHLFRLGTALGIDVAYFFSEPGSETEAADKAILERPSDARLASEARRFAEAFAVIGDEDVRNMIRALVDSLAESDPIGGHDGPGDVSGNIPIAPWHSERSADDDRNT